jgi:hypothetical protein
MSRESFYEYKPEAKGDPLFIADGADTARLSTEAMVAGRLPLIAIPGRVIRRGVGRAFGTHGTWYSDISFDRMIFF